MTVNATINLPVRQFFNAGYWHTLCADIFCWQLPVMRMTCLSQHEKKYQRRNILSIFAERKYRC